MDESQAGLVTQVLKAAGEGDPRAASELLPLVYAELRRLAQARMAKTPPGNTLQPTALVHEAYMRLVGDNGPNWNSRGHFFAAAAESMRQIMVDHARQHASHKRGGGWKRVDGDNLSATQGPPVEELLAVNDALAALEKEDPRKAQVVKLRYFAGLNNEETAAALNISVPTVEREWRFARVLLYSQLEDRD